MIERKGDKGETIVIVGAGAIGRGFLAPYFTHRGYQIRFVDKNASIIGHFDNRISKTYQTAIVMDDRYQMKTVPYLDCHNIDNLENIPLDANYIFFCVGVKELETAAKRINVACQDSRNIKAVYSVENDPGSTAILSKIFPETCEISFGVPDVITSSTAPEELLKQDPLCVVSEIGELFIEGSFLKRDEHNYDSSYVRTHWICKKYLHNTPHAALAYLGAEKNYQYIHQACLDEEIEKLIRRLLASIRILLEKEYNINAAFLNDYADKELRRFRNTYLYDPIIRVGRNPLIKLKPGERLVHIATMFEQNGIQLDDIARVVWSAFQYPNCEEMSEARNKQPLSVLLQKICGISEESQFGKFVLQKGSIHV